MEDKNIKLAALGVTLVDLNEQMKDIEEERLKIKGEISDILKELNLDLALVEIGNDQALVLKNNKRTTKSFDKDSLSVDLDIERDKLDYAGVAEYVEKEKLHSFQVAQYQKKNPCEFITVRIVNVKPKKGGV